jgi:hypothetical protein
MERGPRVRHCGGHGGTCYSGDADRDYIVIRTCSQGQGARGSGYPDVL